MSQLTQENRPPVSVGVIGAGLAGAMHIGTLNSNVPDVNVVAIADTDAARAIDLASTCPGETQVFSDGQSLIADSSVDAVVVAAVASTHAELVTECIRAGKHVFCEKPLAITAEECRSIVELEQSTNRLLVQLGFMRRFDPYYLDFKGQLDAGDIGETVALHSVHRTNFATSEYTSEMLVTEALIHEIDVLRWLLADEFETVSVTSSESKTIPGLRDPQFVQLMTSSGIHNDIEVYVSGQTGYQVNCEAVGTKGTANLSGPSAALVNRQGLFSKMSSHDFRERFQEAYRNEMLEWASSIRGEKSIAPTAWDGYAAALVTDSVLAALRSGSQEKITVPATPDFYR